jgi:hypothetical protein
MKERMPAVRPRDISTKAAAKMDKAAQRSARLQRRQSLIMSRRRPMCPVVGGCVSSAVLRNEIIGDSCIISWPLEIFGGARVHLNRMSCETTPASCVFFGEWAGARGNVNYRFARKISSRCE